MLYIKYVILKDTDMWIDVPEAIGVPGLVDVDETADLAGGEADVLVPDHDLKLLKESR